MVTQTVGVDRRDRPALTPSVRPAMQNGPPPVGSGSFPIYITVKSIQRAADGIAQRFGRTLMAFWSQVRRSRRAHQRVSPYETKRKLLLSNRLCGIEIVPSMRYYLSNHQPLTTNHLASNHLTTNHFPSSALTSSGTLLKSSSPGFHLLRTASSTTLNPAAFRRSCSSFTLSPLQP